MQDDDGDESEADHGYRHGDVERQQKFVFRPDELLSSFVNGEQDDEEEQ